MSAPLLKCLFCEDVPEDYEIVAHELRGMATVELADTREDFTKALAKEYDAIFIDLRMPDWDGQDAIRLARDAQPYTPILVITGSVDDETASIACQAGACDYLRKDRLRRLRMAVSNAVDAARAKAENEERKRREIRNQRLEMLGTLSAGLAHDMNNLLGVIIAGTDALRWIEDGAERKRILDSMTGAGKRGAEMVQQMTAFARGTEGTAYKVTSVEFLLGEVRRMIWDTVHEFNIRLSVRTEVGTWKVRCDATQINQVLLNLVVNSRDAMPQGGELQISARNSAQSTGNFICITVRDSGTGIPESVISKIFDPFYTTKPIGQGTGIGLAMAKQIVEAHGGAIKVVSDSNGTTFDIFLPAQLNDEEEAAKEQFDGGGAAVVLAEDEEFFRSTIQIILEHARYKVLPASNGAEALSLFRSHANIALLLSDHSMPLMDGPELMKNLRSRGYDKLPVVFMTGREFEQVIEPAPQEILHKPLTRDTLLSTLQRVLTTTGAQAQDAPA